MLQPRWLLAAAALGALGGCKRSAPPDPAASAPASASAPVASASASASAAPAASASAAPAAAPLDLASQVITHASFNRRTLYLWVSAEQAALLRRDRTLSEAFRRPSVRRFEGAFAAAKDPTSLGLARALKKADHKAFGMAWGNLWGRALTTSDGSKSRRLVVRIALRPDAVVASFDPSAKAPWRFVDAQGKDVQPGKVMARPERLAAIYFPSSDPSARGYVLLGEEAFASWSLETPEIDAELASAEALLASLPAPADAEPPEAWPQQVVASWSSGEPPFEASLALADPAYSLAHRASLLDTFRAARASAPPLVVKPSPTPFGDLVEKGVQKQVCTEHGDKTRCAPLPPARRRAHDGRFCTDEQGRMVDCPRR